MYLQSVPTDLSCDLEAVSRHHKASKELQNSLGKLLSNQMVSLGCVWTSASAHASLFKADFDEFALHCIPISGKRFITDLEESAVKAQSFHEFQLKLVNTWKSIPL